MFCHFPARGVYKTGKLTHFPVHLNNGIFSSTFESFPRRSLAHFPRYPTVDRPDISRCQTPRCTTLRTDTNTVATRAFNFANWLRGSPPTVSSFALKRNWVHSDLRNPQSSGPLAARETSSVGQGRDPDNFVNGHEGRKKKHRALPPTQAAHLVDPSVWKP